jgi:site-specific recombinase XerD
VTPTDLREYRGYLLNVERRQPATVNRRLAALRKFFTWAKSAGLITELPTEQVRGVKAMPRAPKWLEKRDVDRLMRAVEGGGNKRDLAILQLLRHAGLRVSELVNVRLDDLELSERKGQVQVQSKGGKHRVVPLNVDVRRAIEAYLQVRPQTADPSLFISSHDRQLTTRAVEDVVSKYAHLAGVQDVTPHTLRHTFGKHLVEAGVDLGAVATLLGHERLGSTAIYIQLSKRQIAPLIVAALENRPDGATILRNLLEISAQWSSSALRRVRRAAGPRR